MKITIVFLVLTILITGCSKDWLTNSWAAYYANLAVSQNEENIKNKCGFSGRRWQSNYNNHFSWANSVSKSAAQGEIDARTSQLRNCKKK